MSRVSCTDPDLAQALGLPHGESDFVLEYVAGRLQLRDTRRGAPGPIFAGFDTTTADNRRKAGKSLMLAKAVGVKKGAALAVLDATAGLGRDAYSLAALGCRVTAMERSPIVAMLLRDALYRAAEDPAVTRILPLVGDCREEMAARRYDVVYLDPMFPERGKAAKSKKEMQYMQALVGEEESSGLLAPALACATRRVVVKRPLHAPPLEPAPKPSHTHKGKSVRFDVYLVRG